MLKAILVDLDDVLFYTNPIFERARALNLSGNDLWTYFHSKVAQCEINNWCKDLISCFYKIHVVPIFITARSEEIREITNTILSNLFLDKPFELYMRKLDDRRPSDVVKEEILQNEIIPRFDVQFALDDDIKNCEMYVQHGIPVLHVLNAEGKVIVNDQEEYRKEPA